MGKKQQRKKPDSKSGWILYVMVHFPGIWWWKVGITGKSASERSKGIDRAVWGRPIPIMITVIPGGAYQLEQFIGFIIEPFHTRFYKGDGSTEWFWFIGGFIAFLILLLINFFWYLAISGVIKIIASSYN